MNKPELLTDEQIDVIEQRIYCQTIQKGKPRGEYVFKVSRAIESSRDAQWEAMLKQEPVAQPKTDTDLINAGCRYTTDLTAPQPAPEKQDPITRIVEMLDGVIKQIKQNEREALQRRVNELLKD